MQFALEVVILEYFNLKHILGVNQTLNHVGHCYQLKTFIDKYQITWALLCSAQLVTT